MFKINKKLWSFNFGCLIAGSFVWLVSIGLKAPVPEVLYPHTNFVLDYYSGLVTAVATGMLTLLILIIMGKAFKLCTSDHTFWLVLLTLSFLALTVIASQSMLMSIAYQKYPCESIMSGTSYGKYINLRNNPVSPINTRKTIGFFVEFSNVLTISNFVDNLRSL